jgi:hypothetical protein
LLIIPQIRSLIIAFGEMYIVHRPLNVPHWHQRIISLARMGGLFFIIIAAPEQISRKILAIFSSVYKKHFKLCYLVILLPVLWGLIIVSLFGVNIPVWDEWGGIINFLDSALTHGLKFEDLIAQHNEHRILFPRLLFYFFGLLSKVNIKVYMYISWLLNVIMYITVIIYINNNTDASMKAKSIFLHLALGFCLFNLVQSGNIFWGFQLGFFMVASFSVVCFFFFYKWLRDNKHLYCIVSVTAGIIASFSSAHGLIVFPVMLFILILLLFSKEKDTKKNIMLIALIGVFIYMLYFYNYHKPQYHPDLFGASLVNLLIYFIFNVPGLKPPPLGGKLLAWIS